MSSPYPKMHNVSTRCHALATYTLVVLGALTFACFVTTGFRGYSTVVDINTVKVFVRNVPEYNAFREKGDIGFMLVDLKADLRPLFNWNVKQLFLYLTAEYETSSNKLNQVVIWDKIIQRGENAVLDFKNMRPKYYFWDDGNGLRGNKNVTLFLSWNVIPNAGHLPMFVARGTHQFAFPEEYTTRM